jgi:uncharacterized protein (DUF2342 family)
MRRVHHRHPYSRQAVSNLDPNNLEELSGTGGGLFEPQKTPEQLATLDLLALLALVEGWVDEVASWATANWMPSAAALAETVWRLSHRRACRGDLRDPRRPELRPRRMRMRRTRGQPCATHAGLKTRRDLVPS